MRTLKGKRQQAILAAAVQAALLLGYGGAARADEADDAVKALTTPSSTVEVGDGKPARMAEWVALRVLAKQSEAMLAGLAHRLENTHV